MQLVRRLQYAHFQPNVMWCYHIWLCAKQWHRNKRKPKNLQRNVILLVGVFVAWYTCILAFHCHSTFVCSQTLWRWGWLYAIAPNLTARQQADQNPPAPLHYACFTVVNVQQNDSTYVVYGGNQWSDHATCRLFFYFYFYISEIWSWGVGDLLG